jgi:hypothetical protein
VTSAKHTPTLEKPRLGKLVADGKTIGYRGRAAAMRVGAKDICVIAATDTDLAYLAKEWFGFKLDLAECRDGIIIPQKRFDALVAALEEADAELRTIVGPSYDIDPAASVVRRRAALKAAKGEA